MARKDDILISFLEHDLLKSKYELTEGELPKTIRDAIKSQNPVIKTIALIVDNMENPTPITDSALRNLVTQYLNESAL